MQCLGFWVFSLKNYSCFRNEWKSVVAKHGEFIECGNTADFQVFTFFVHTLECNQIHRLAGQEHLSFCKGKEKMMDMFGVLHFLTANVTCNKCLHWWYLHIAVACYARHIPYRTKNKAVISLEGALVMMLHWFHILW